MIINEKRYAGKAGSASVEGFRYAHLTLGLQAVVLAHQMAIESALIQAEMVAPNEFYEIAMRYNVIGVPQTNINDGAGVILGAVDEDDLLKELKKSVKFLAIP